jgi:SanA protein
MIMVKSAVTLTTLLLLVVLINYFSFERCGRNHLIDIDSDIKPGTYVLVPGAGRDYPNGRRPNYFFLGRMSKTAELHKAQPQLKIILSGIADGHHYNEAIDMKKDLLLRGVDSSAMILDNGSVDTYETIKMYDEHYKHNPVIIISQKEHLFRALWLAEKRGLKAEGIIADGNPYGTPRWFIVREMLARMKARYDILMQ